MAEQSHGQTVPRIIVAVDLRHSLLLQELHGSPSAIFLPLKIIFSDKFANETLPGLLYLKKQNMTWTSFGPEKHQIFAHTHGNSGPCQEQRIRFTVLIWAIEKQFCPWTQPYSALQFVLGFPNSTLETGFCQYKVFTLDKQCL
eukprot:6485274-Amphidinium_carterae.1